MFNKRESLLRIRVRLERVEHFINYLQEEELREKDTYSLDMPLSELFTSKAIEEFEHEKKRVLKSAKAQPKRKKVGNGK